MYAARRWILVVAPEGTLDGRLERDRREVRSRLDKLRGSETEQAPPFESAIEKTGSRKDPRAEKSGGTLPYQQQVLEEDISQDERLATWGPARRFGDLPGDLNTIRTRVAGGGRPRSRTETPPIRSDTPGLLIMKPYSADHTAGEVLPVIIETSPAGDTTYHQGDFAADALANTNRNPGTSVSPAADVAAPSPLRRVPTMRLQPGDS
jgi:hypothetical protein